MRVGDGTRAVRVDSAGGIAVEILSYPDIGSLLRDPDWSSVAAQARGAAHPLDGLGRTAFAPVVPHPQKIVCVGLNYREHILEMGRDLPEHPTLFAKYADALIGAGDDIVLPRPVAGTVDWEGELALVIGRTVRGVSREEAAEAIAGFTVMNDITVRGHQYRTSQWLQGKTFEGTTPLGPVLVTPDELPAAARITTFVSGVRKQSAPVSDLAFDPAALVGYVSEIVTLRPGDVIATGTPGGVGHASRPPEYLSDGEEVVVTVEGIGAVRNRLRVVDAE
ncbi:2-hydroxyhepta-2,4-diene-1,7-dioate isomerase [Microbacterium album]|uniref:2-hydroxyhepta-2,4-diene-1,7-dioate isomerase n=1 Tax=Microbacterium album TaxID=2053191 RepID=A0A917IEX5_9MICO|nr:2-hydroxyhepta-2,4-diene-1,7-dioate isomerase [Microbacterium album]